MMPQPGDANYVRPYEYKHQPYKPAKKKNTNPGSQGHMDAQKCAMICVALLFGPIIILVGVVYLIGNFFYENCCEKQCQKKKASPRAAPSTVSEAATPAVPPPEEVPRPSEPQSNDAPTVTSPAANQSTLPYGPDSSRVGTSESDPYSGFQDCPSAVVQVEDFTSFHV